MAVWIFPAVWRNLRSALALTSFSSLFGSGGGSVDFDRDRFLAFVVAIVVNSLSVFQVRSFLTTSFFFFFAQLNWFWTAFVFELLFFVVGVRFFRELLRHVRKNFQLINYYNNNGIFFNLLRVCRTATKSLLR
jgi:hypothetical protein